MTDSSHRQFLTALQLADSFFPTGLFAHSQGLEGMVAHGAVRTAADVHQFLENLLTWSVLPCDGVALLNAHLMAGRDDLATVTTIDGHLHAMKLPAELRTASRHAGRRILDEFGGLATPEPHPTLFEEYRSLVARRETPGTGAVALGITAWAAGIAAETALLMFCHSFAVGVLGAAQRLLPFTHSQAQQILYCLHIVIDEQLDRCSGRSWQEISAFTPALDIASMLHETDEVRLFAS